MSAGAARIAATVTAVALVLLLVLAAFPWGLLARSADRRIGEAIGRDVRIGEAHRVDWLSFHPTVALRNVTIGQPAWAGRGEMARIGEVRVAFPVWPLLRGRFRPDGIDLDGVRAELRRDARGRANWEGEPRPDRPRRRLPGIDHLTIADGRIYLIDRKRQVELSATIVSDAVAGFRLDGTGRQRGMPLAVRVRGAALSGRSGAAYPMTLSTRSPLASLDARAVLDRPFALSNLSAHVVASGRDLDYLDDILQAGLVPTQRFRLEGDARRDEGRWTLRNLDASIGRSRMRANAVIEDRGVRTHIDATVDARTLDFADFQSDAQKRRGQQKERARGPRVLPDTRILIGQGGIAKLDATVRLHATRLLGDAGSPFRSLDTVAVLDDRRLTLDPLRLGLVAGVASGRAVVDARGRMPQLSLAMAVKGSRIEALLTKTGSMRGPLAMAIRLAGRGPTIARAIGRSDGHVGVVTDGGDTRRDYATFAGGDVFKSIGAVAAGPGARIPLRCLIGSFDVRGGRMTPNPLVIDTPTSRTDGSGQIDLADETIALSMAGRSKEPELLRSTTPARVFGTLSSPQIDIKPPRAGNERQSSTIERIGAFFKGLRTKGDRRQDAPAPDADCTGLTRKALHG